MYARSLKYWLHFVMASIYGSISASVGKSPHHIIYGTDKRLTYNIDDYSVRQTQVFNSIHTEVRKHLEASRYEMMLKQNARAAKIDVAIKDTLMIKASERLSKLAPKFLAPSVITLEGHGNTIVKDINTGKVEIVHVYK